MKGLSICILLFAQTVFSAEKVYTQKEFDKKLNESLIKKLTGGDEIKARQPREKFINFSPTHTLWMFVNHKPRITETDEGIWRRIKLIPFEYKIPDEEVRDQSVIFKEFELESPGILNWAIEG